ncbi:MAG: hypothetical protein GXO50_04560 [Chlorobi bacterium]|nr:hypothetical protein [Chlorobiota bacterium]
MRQKKYKGYKYDRIFETVETTENRKTIKSIFLFDFYDRISEIFIINLIPNNYTPLVKKERAFPARFYIYYPDGFNTHHIKIFYDISEKFDKGNNKILKIISDKAVFIFNYYENGLMKKISKYYEENNKVFDTEFKYVYYK